MVDHHSPVFLAAWAIVCPERTSLIAYSVCADRLAPIHFLLDIMLALCVILCQMLILIALCFAWVYLPWWVALILTVLALFADG
jgi:hypothetical protein